jgi:hypothetical protein
MTAAELRARNADAYHWQHEWALIMSAKQWILADMEDPNGAAVPTMYALQLLIDHFGGEQLKSMINMAA